MARVASHLAAKIDRLSRTAHRFHRFAHHPLCDEYSGELIRLGRRNRVCRGCLSVAIGGLVGLVMSMCFSATPSALLMAWAVGVVAVVSSMLVRSTRTVRAPKLLSRFLPALVIAYALGCAVQLGSAGRVLAALSAVPLVGVVSIYRRRGPDRTPCASCAERHLATPCRGIAPIVRRERAFRRLAGQWLARVDQ